MQISVEATNNVIIAQESWQRTGSHFQNDETPRLRKYDSPRSHALSNFNDSSLFTQEHNVN
jgi:hypothetical protein